MNSSNGLLSSPNRWKKWGMCPQPAASFLRIIFSLQLKIVSNSVYANCISPLTFHILLCNIISKIFIFLIVNVWYLCASRTVFFDMSVFVCARLGLEVLKILKKIYSWSGFGSFIHLSLSTQCSFYEGKFIVIMHSCASASNRN